MKLKHNDSVAECYVNVALSRTREAIAAGITSFLHIPGKANPSDILSKHWDMPSVWNVLQPLMFYIDPKAESVDDTKVKKEETPKES